MRSAGLAVALSLGVVSVAIAGPIHSIELSNPPSGVALAKVKPQGLAQRRRDADKLRGLLGTTLAPNQVKTSHAGTNQFARNSVQLLADREGKVTSAKRTVVEKRRPAYAIRRTEVSQYGTRLSDRLTAPDGERILRVDEPRRGSPRTELSVRPTDGALYRVTSSRDASNARPHFSTRTDDEKAWAPDAVEAARTLGRTISVRSSYGRIPVRPSDDAAAVERVVAERRAAR